MMKQISKLIPIQILIQICLIPISITIARPTILQEQTLSYHQGFLQGIYVGWESFLGLAGYYEEAQVSEGVAQQKLIIDPEEEENQTTIQVVGLGLGRTGTTSLVMALEILGYMVVHDDEQTEITDLYAAEEREEIDMDEFHEILGLRGFNATVKTAGMWWVKRHPEVKAILTVRDTPDKYVDSWLVAAPFVELLYKRPFCWLNTVEELLPSFEQEFRGETTDGNPDRFLDRETLRENYIDYLEDVQEKIPEDRLLVFNVKEGWEPLCKFLNKPVPEGIPFPHVHTRAKLEGEMWFLWLVTWIWPLGISLPLALVLYLLKRTKGYRSLFGRIRIPMFVLVCSILLFVILPETVLDPEWDEDDDDDDWEDEM